MDTNEAQTLSRDEAFAWQVDEYLTVYEPSEAIKHTERLEQRLIEKGCTLADYVSGQQAIKARIRELDRLNPPPSFESLSPKDRKDAEKCVRQQEKHRVTLERRRAELRQLLVERGM